MENKAPKWAMVTNPEDGYQYCLGCGKLTDPEAPEVRHEDDCNAVELLAGLEAMEKWTACAFDANDPDMDLPELEQARAAIAKARGR